MDLSVINEAVKLPFQEENWIKKNLIGTILTLASFLIIPAPLLMGYILRVMREDSMPGFNNLLEMYIDGLKGLTVVILYLIPGLILISAFEESLLAAPGLLVLFIGWWSFESGLYQLANHGFKQAFSKKAVRQAFTFKYLLGILASGLISVAIFILYGISLLLVVTVLLYPTVQFYQVLVRYRIIKNAIEA